MALKNILFCKLVLIYLYFSNCFSSPALSIPRCDLASTSSENIAIFAGGNIRGRDYAPTTMVDIFDYNKNVWRNDTSLSQARFWISGISLKQYHFFAGGYTRSVFSDVIDIYDETTGQWSTSKLSVPRANIGMATYGSKVYFAGGWMDNASSNRIDIYDIDTAKWTIDRLPVPRNSMGVAVIQDLIIYAGGIGPVLGQYSSVVNMYNITSNSWQNATLQVPRAFYGAAAVGNVAYFIAGRTTHADGTDTIESYNVVTKKWNLFRCPIPDIAAVSEAGVIGHTVIMSSVYNAVSYDTVTEVWSPLVTLNRSAYTLVTINNKAIFAGGIIIQDGQAVAVDTIDIVQI